MKRTTTIILALIFVVIVAIVVINLKSVDFSKLFGSNGTPGNTDNSGNAGSGSSSTNSSSGSTGTSAGSSSGSSSTGNSSTPVAVVDDSIPKDLIDLIYVDLTCIFCTRNTSLYTRLLGLGDTAFQKGYYYWDTVYGPQFDGYSLPRYMRAQASFNSTFNTLRDQIVARYATFNLS